MAGWQHIDELQDIAADLPRFIEDLTHLVTRTGLDIRDLNADHISLRCHQNATAERWRRGFEQCGELLSENLINGRPICLFRLSQPVQVAHWAFSVVELPWPGKNVTRTRGGSISKLYCRVSRKPSMPARWRCFRMRG